MSNTYGYIGEAPIQAQNSNSGVFSMSDIIDLTNLGQWTQEIVQVESLVIAGGGGGGYGYSSGRLGGGGGAGGYRSSYQADTYTGGLAVKEAILNVNLDTNFTITVGAGGTSNNKGNDSVFSTITSLAGGAGHQLSGSGTMPTVVQVVERQLKVVTTLLVQVHQVKVLQGVTAFKVQATNQVQAVVVVQVQ